MGNKFKNGDYVAVYGGTTSYDGGREYYWNSGHNGTVVSQAEADCVYVKFDGRCGDLDGCVSNGTEGLAHVNQLRKATKPPKKRRTKRRSKK